MTTATHVTNVTSDDPSTYTSSSLAKFAWTDDPFGDHGFLHVVFKDGGRYVYLGVPEEVAEELESRGRNPEEHTDSVGEYFYKAVRNQYRRRNEEYVEMEA